MKSIKSIIWILTFVFASNIIYGQSINYIPENSQITASFNYESITEKAGKDTIDNILKKIGSSKFSELYGVLKNIEAVGLDTKDKIRMSITFPTNRSTDKFNTGVIVSIKDKNIFESFIKTRLNKLVPDVFEIFQQSNYTLIKYIKTQNDEYEEYSNEYSEEYYDENEMTEDESVVVTEESPSMEGEVKYKDSIFLAYNDEVLVIADSIEIIENIFAKNKKLTSDTFISLSKENNDIDMWMKTSFIYSYSMAYSLIGNGGGVPAMYENATITAKLNFYDGSIMLDIEQYNPDYKVNSKNMTVKIDKNLYKHFNEKNNIMFISLALNLEEYYNTIMNMGNETSKSIIDAIASRLLSKYNITMEDIFNVIRGDAFLTLDLPSNSESINDFSFTLSVGIKDQKKLNAFLNMMTENETFSKSKVGKTEVYNVEYENFNLFIQDGNLYVCSENILPSLIKGKPSKKKPMYMTKLANENMFSLYFDIEKVIKIFMKLYQTSKNFDVFKNVEIKSNYVNDNHSKTTIVIIMKDKNKKSLNILLNLLTEL